MPGPLLPCCRSRLLAAVRSLHACPAGAPSRVRVRCLLQELVLLEKEQELLEKEQTVMVLREEVR